MLCTLHRCILVLDNLNKTHILILQSSRGHPCRIDTFLVIISYIWFSKEWIKDRHYRPGKSLCPKSPIVRGFVASLPVHLLFNTFYTMHCVRFRQHRLNTALRQRRHRVKCIVSYVLKQQVNRLRCEDNPHTGAPGTQCKLGFHSNCIQLKAMRGYRYRPFVTYRTRFSQDFSYII